MADGRFVTGVLRLNTTPTRLALLIALLLANQLNAGCFSSEPWKPWSDASASLERQCIDAAAQLGSSVPCPTRLPGSHSDRFACDDDCLGRGAPDIEIFSIELVDFGWPVLGEIQHVVIEERPRAAIGPRPCYGAERLDAPGLTRGVSAVVCAEGSAQSQRDNLLGEGGHAGHTVVFQDVGDERTIVSVHGHGDEARSLAVRIFEGLEYVG